MRGNFVIALNFSNKLVEIFGQATKNIDNYRTKISAQTKEISELKDQLKEYQTREEQYKIDLDANQSKTKIIKLYTQPSHRYSTVIIEKLSNEKESVEKTIDGLVLTCTCKFACIHDLLLERKK
jgi:predicted RNase H-like nuclease (RuvC/YqgF family)